MNERNCVFLLSTYDGGIDLWDGFFTALLQQWPSFDMPVFINTETKDYSFRDLDITVLKSGNKVIPWAKGLKRALKRIDSEYVLFFLEDYWLDAPVDADYFRKTLRWMEKNPDISTVSFYPCMPGTNLDDNAFEGMELRPKKCLYKLNCQVALWRRQKLIKYLRNHEDPWEWEVNGSIRATRYRERFYTLKEGEHLPFSYGDPMVGCLIHRGKWVKERAMLLNEKYGLNLDFSQRGFEVFEEPHPPRKESFWNKLRKPHLFTRVKEKIIRDFRKLLSII